MGERAKRPYSVNTWLSTEEYDAVLEAAKVSGLSTAAFTRMAVVARARGLLHRWAHARVATAAAAMEQASA